MVGIYIIKNIINQNYFKIKVQRLSVEILSRGKFMTPKWEALRNKMKI